LSRLKSKWHPPEEFFKKWNKYRKLLYETAEYQTLLAEVRARACGMCERCQKRGREVHHKVRVYDDPSLALDPNNCEFLCRPCHTKHHKKDKKK
jgi:5-methylcytosine-specific restriction endonuclease McrA